MAMTAIEKHRREIAEKLRAGANVHETMARLCRNEDAGAEAYHLDMARVMREAATMIEGEG